MILENKILTQFYLVVITVWFKMAIQIFCIWSVILDLIGTVKLYRCFLVDVEASFNVGATLEPLQTLRCKK